MVKLGLSNQLLAGLLLVEYITDRNQIELNIFSISTFGVSSPKTREPTNKYKAEWFQYHNFYSRSGTTHALCTHCNSPSYLYCWCVTA